MIFNLYSRVKVKVGDDEEHVFDATRLMYTEVAEIEKCTGTPYGEWRRQLGEYSITAIAALLHVLRKRDGQSSDFAAMQFNAATLDVIPLHEDDREFTAAEVEADMTKRLAAAAETANPISATAAAVAPENGSKPATTISSPSSQSGSGSGRGNGRSSSGKTSSSSRASLTPRLLPVPRTPRDAAAVADGSP